MWYIGPIEFEWHEAKSKSNFQKHGVDFYEAQTVFGRTQAMEFLDEGNGEERFIRIGWSARGNLLVVCFCERGSSIRLISARKATLREMEMYEKGI